jgi:hypothetical protein
MWNDCNFEHYDSNCWVLKPFILRFITEPDSIFAFTIDCYALHTEGMVAVFPLRRPPFFTSLNISS